MRQYLPVEGAMLLRHRDGQLVPICVEGLQARVLEMRFPLDNKAVVGDVEERLPHRRVGQVGLLSAYENVPEEEHEPGIIVGVPLFVEDNLVGALNVGALDPHAFDDMDDEELSVYAALAAASLRTADLISELEQSNELRQKIALQLQEDARERLDGPLLGDGKAIRKLRREIEVAASLDSPLLLVCPAAAGAESVARAIHQASERREAAFIYVSCALQAGAVHDLVDADTGDGGPRAAAKFDLAAGGTLFLDGIERLPLRLQDALTARIQKAASSRRRHPQTPSVRIIATSTVDLSGRHTIRIRNELSELLGARTINVPSLAERRDDLPVLVDFYACRHAQRFGIDDKVVSEKTLSALQRYSWPGNLSELSNVIERAVVTATGEELVVDESMLEERVTMGSYTLVEPLGEGGMGIVWLAKHKLLHKPAAVKVIRPEELKTFGDIERTQHLFMKEAQATANLRSLHTVEVYDFGVSDDGCFYYAMERLYGLNLDAMVEQCGPLPPERAVELLKQACLSLGDAHEAGLVHRDVKPANLFACSGPEFDFLKVLDFGLVVTPEEAMPPPSVFDEAAFEQYSLNTSASMVQGTPGFMPPEAILKRRVDRRADIYALGCVAYWLLAGRLVFECESLAALLSGHIATPPESLCDVTYGSVSAKLDAIVARCLAKDPGKRFQSTEDLRQALDALQFDNPWTRQRAREWWHDNRQFVAERQSREWYEAASETRKVEVQELPRVVSSAPDPRK